ncbi:MULTISPECIES: S9 family peptidase [unclassified Breznakia]|uniref:alpha/beta hydrolase family protein n=1 Tax=unclassified Breznakia TaxID=2623764 RepID=UPI002472FF7B|nr:MULTISPECIES: S9 family peptidase [unclassified Breznakia]MDH6367583.1 dipeptidyl aminopeptidase/acylaminoacyl peptidase [Breznakia sp. PH1-1]MDH6404703.1 dipeptidyl aminopeptidase/acylaminoacyl peptidase [Breznakia sp. PF1-11]MDH6412413.1 dipeptidyl aminopeptidase/acylaminoacyl peptidase [Breznakia sp. PFB1-11]MDH6414778.1 dipeptidyl aminopeptidase/acylaminoacyl peptidase [Breznakia sp. PFB1-14]MDH6417084.1 dipeptidyl aminopeptidase/acylaminoacyl peptidase [Breznakia sp. PFB1-4]
MRKIELRDFLDFKHLSQLKVKDKNAIYVETVMNADDNVYESDLYQISEITIKTGDNTLYHTGDSKRRRLTNSKDVSNFIYTDKDTILFASMRDPKDKERAKNGESFTSFYELHTKGGEATKAFEIPFPVSDIKFIDSNTYIVNVSYDLRYAPMLEDGKKEEVAKAKNANKDWEELTKIPFVQNGGEYIGYTVSRLYLYTRDTNKLTAITNTYENAYILDVSKDKEKVLFATSKDAAKPSMKEGLSQVNLKDLSVEELVKESEYSIATAFYRSHDILVLANKETPYGINENAKFFSYANETMTLLSNPDRAFGNSVGSDVRYGGGFNMKMLNDTLYILSTETCTCNLYKLTADNHFEEVLDVDGSIDAFDTEDGQDFYYIGLIEQNLQEIYKNKKAITHINTTLDDAYVATPEIVTYKNEDYDMVGYVLLPKDYDPAKSYPAILDIHGGPKTVYGKVYYHEMQVWANQGYFVFFTNPRGSDGRGNDFMDIFGKYGTIDYEDLMVFTDVVLKKYPAIDTNRLGVTGGSYGGFMTNWIITHTDRFKVAATQRCISNWVSFYGTSDIGFYFAPDQNKGDIFSDKGIAKLWEHSPLKYISNVKTPTLIIHSDKDYRCPLEQAEQLFTALKVLGVESKMVVFHGDNHDLSRSGKIQSRIKRLSEITDWMNAHL